MYVTLDHNTYKKNYQIIIRRLEIYLSRKVKISNKCRYYFRFAHRKLRFHN